MKKRGKVKAKANGKKWIVRGFLLGFFFVLFFIIVIGFKISEKKEEGIKEIKEFKETGELGSFGILRLEKYNITNLTIIGYNCSNESLKEIWNSVFKESSNGIVVISDKNVQGNCNNSLMYKILSNNLTYFIYLRYSEGKSSITGESYNYFGNFTGDFLNSFWSMNSSNLISFYNLINDKLNIAYAKSKSQGTRNIADETSANNEYDSIFKIPSQTWSFINDNANVNGNAITGPVFYYIHLSSDNSIINRFSSINPNYTLDYLYYMEYFIKNLSMAKTANIPNIDLKGSRRHYDVIKLEDYFANLQSTDENLTFSYSLSSSNAFRILQNNYFNINHSLDFDTSSSLGGSYIGNISLSYFGSNAVSNNFNISINGCLDSDNGYDIFIKGVSQNLTNSTTDRCVGNISNGTMMEYYCGLNGEILGNSAECPFNYSCYDGACIQNGSRNNAPVFLSNSCDGIAAIRNTNFKIDMNGCFRDEDNDSLIFRYEIVENGSWVIIRNLTTLIVVPNKNWVGKGRFNIYARDVFSETKGVVNFEIISTGLPPVAEPEKPITVFPEVEEEFKIMNPYPMSSDVSLSVNQSLVFSIGNTEYDSIEWYLDGLFIKSNSVSFNANSLTVGNHVIKVEIRKREKTDSKTWNLVIRTAKEQRKYIIGKIVFWLLIMIISVLMAIIVLLIIKESKKLASKPKFKFL